LLIEVGVEEIPSRYLEPLAADFLRGVTEQLALARLDFDHESVWYTPRRLIFQARVAPRQTPQEEVVRGPAVSAAWKDGVPTPALLGFARRVGVAVDQLERQMVGANEYVMATRAKPVASVETILGSLVDDVLTAMPKPRTMRWDESDARFVRPVRWLLLLLDDVVVSGQALGVPSGHCTFGNRTDHPGPIEVGSVAEYWNALARGRVEVDGQRRRQVIIDEGTRLAHAVGGGIDFDGDLLEEVANLVEWPTPFLGEFSPDFLQIPAPILVTSMRVHQRYFPVRGESDALLPYFVAVRNGVGDSLDLVRHGNEKVLRARLSDAQYFFARDRQQRLIDRVAGLSQVTLHARVGTYQDKINRIKALFAETREWWGLGGEIEALFKRSVDLYKCDLLTQVVSEFPELQGEMGAIYARLDGEDNRVVAAVADQYRPAHAEDRLPQDAVAQILGLLDRVDTLTAFYGVGIRPSGSEDPFGLRRVALGLALLAAQTPVLGEHSITELLQVASRQGGAGTDVVQDVRSLVVARLVSVLEAHWPIEFLHSVLARDFPWSRLETRLTFLKQHRSQADAVIAAFKRVERITREAVEPSELCDLAPGIEAELGMYARRALAIEENHLHAWWDSIVQMLPLIAQFFADVLVMDPDPQVRNRRLALLLEVKRALGRYFDWERL
jgi:glycyl-tRNA synthetase beta chain